MDGGSVSAIAVTNQGEGISDPGDVSVDISTVTPDMLDAANGEIFLKSDPSKSTTHASVTSGWGGQIVVATGWRAYLRAHGVGTAKKGDPCNSNSSCASVIEVAVDPETGDVEILGDWNSAGVGTSVFKTSVMKELGSGIELHLGQTMTFGDVYDPSTAAVLQMSHGNFGQHTTLDLSPEAFHLYDIQNDNPAGPCGANGFAEPASGSTETLMCAIFNATGKWIDWQHGAGGPNQVLRALGLG
jgi:CO/xanthine dehydrogenase Mo-binding subunit